MTIAFPAWYYDEIKQVGVDFEDTAQVEAYDRKQKSNTPEVNQALIQRLGINKGHKVIEIGCGTGTFSIQAALTGAKVHAVDVSESMLSYAENKAKAAGATNIEFHHAGFLSYEHKDEPVDFIITKAAFHHLPDFWKTVGLLRMWEMLKPEGILYLQDAIFSFDAAEWQYRIDDWITRAAKPTGEGFSKADFEMHVREEYSTFAWIIEGMLKRTGLEVVEVNYITPEITEFISKKRSHQ
ncbi:type 11 methyltransferase [Calothrix sp. NIES-4071]|nr:type 11 methyltransferase [Calothrix sp. NIES-4071]BAZ63160.1 type 11 methyltransferase [Calothrix sp. NIES-4105]